MYLFRLDKPRTLFGKYCASGEAGGDPCGDKLAEWQQILVQRRQEADRERLDVERMWKKYTQLVTSQLRIRSEKERVLRNYILPTVDG